MKVYNTLSGDKQTLDLNPEVSMYVCGPTTYNYIHLGNARPLVVFDTVRRYLEYKGFKVKYIQNFTDVDDKIIQRANELGQDPLELSNFYIEQYFADADKLGIIRADVHPRVSEHIEDIIVAIKTLIDKGYAYELNGDVYYRVKAFAEYGKLSGRSLDDMLAGARVEVDMRKEEAADFALWKSAKPGEPYWESPWSKGRPGWHIECSVMSTRYLGDTVDIHGGGSDLIFPHHENEIAQAEAITGKPFVRYWMHNGFITVNKEKMSKSLGNFFILRDILDRFPADVVRYYLVATHYRSPLDFDDGKLEEAGRALNRLKTTLILAEEFKAGGGAEVESAGGKGLELEEKINGLRKNFIEAMDDDFNTARAIGYLFEMSHQLNIFIADAAREDKQNQEAIRRTGKIFYELGSVLGIFTAPAVDSDSVSEKLLPIFGQLRNQARQEKNYALADDLRNWLSSQGIAMEDQQEDSRFRYDHLPEPNVLIEKLLALRAEFKKNKVYIQADFIRDSLQERGIIIEDTREGVRFKIVEK
ncbi:MAG TPA: cysteine--tRNA ligase [Syntrophomonadaceae bacterium]|nr:cysteine--tRNA ligase [Syntrophomonadaceae bacterium]HRX21194.1 cysteine--tRNA ligase [Syntrophomonadaceae bacterium]